MMFTKPDFSFKMKHRLSDCLSKRKNSDQSFIEKNSHDSDSLLHTSSSSRSSASPMSLAGMDETIMSEMTGVGMNEQFFVTDDDNPEAMFDMLTLQSIRERYSDIDDNKVSSTEDISAAVISDQEFDNFVRDFPIDDSISECFAASSDQTVPSVNVLTKNSNSPSKQNKLKKKLVQRNGTEETILSDEDSRSSDSKRSKLIGNLFGRRNKGKDGYKPLKQTDTSTGNDITDAIIDACEHITKSYKKPKSSSGSNSVTSDKSVNKKDKIGKPSGNSDTNSEKSRSLSLNGSPNKTLKNHEKVQLRKLPPLPDPDDVTCVTKTKDVYPPPVQSMHDSVNRISGKRTMYSGNNIFENIDNCSDEQLIQDLSSLPENSIIEYKDKLGNTILHRCILANKEETALVLLANYPDLVRIVNNEGLAAVDLSVKVGRLKCLKFLIETQYRTSEIDKQARIVNLAAEYNKIECLKVIIGYLIEHKSSHTLPTDIDGNTAAHVAAIKGHLNCLQLLVENGFSVWNANKAGHRPMQLAVQNDHLDCFHYLLMLECTQCLINQATSEAVRAERLRSQRVSLQTSMQQLGQHLTRYYTQFNDALRNMLESRANIIHSVDSVYNCTNNMVQNTDLQHDEVLRNDIENLKAEMERLQDLLEFSPLAGSSDVLSRMVSGFQELLVYEKESNKLENDPEVNTEDTLNKWSSLMSTFHSMPHACSGSHIEKNIEDLVQSLKNTVISHNQSHKNTEQRNNAENKNSRSNGLSVRTSSTLPHRHVKNRHRKEDHRQRSRNSRNKEAIKDQGGDYRHRGRFNNVSDADSESTLSELPLLESPSGTESLCTSTLTSGVTCTDMTSEKTSLIGTMSGDSSDSESDWWDDHRHKRRHRSKLNRQYNVYDDDSESQSTVRLNLQHEDLPDDILRQHRLNQHLQSMQKVNNHRNDFVETVITASGKRMGGREEPSKMSSLSNKQVINSLSNNSKTQAKDKNTRSNVKEKQRTKTTRLFSLQDAVSAREMSPSEFLESYDRSKGVPDLRWDEMSLTDGEDPRQTEKPWYEMSDDEESIIHTWKSDDEDDQSRNRILL